MAANQVTASTFLIAAGAVYRSDVDLVWFMDTCSTRDLCVTGGRDESIYLWELRSAVDLALIKCIRTDSGACNFRVMGLAFVPDGPLASLFVANSNGDDLSFPTLQYVQLYRREALLTTLLCLRRCAPALYAASMVEGPSPGDAAGPAAAPSTGSSAAPRTPRAPRSSSLLMLICERAGLEPPRCKCLSASSCGFTSRCTCFGAPQKNPGHAFRFE